MTIEKINTWQATALLTMSIIPTAILFPPAVLAELAGRDAWLAFLLAGVLGLLLAGFIIILSSAYPEYNLLQIGEAVMGPFFGKMITLAYVFFFIIVSAIVVREFSAFMVSSFMQFTPLEILSGVIVTMAMYAIYLGLEVICRVSEIVFIVVMTSLLFFVVLSIPELDLRSILPVVDSGMQPVFNGSIVFFVWTGEIFFLSMLYPYLNRPAQAWQAAVITVSVVTIFMVISVFITESYFGFQLTSRILFPLLAYVRLIGIGFWERIEALVILIWVAGMYIKISFFIYMAVVAVKQLFGLSQYRPLILPMGSLVFILSVIMFENTIEISVFLRDVWPFFAPLYALIFPLLFYLTHLVKSLKS